MTKVRSVTMAPARLARLEDTSSPAAAPAAAPSPAASVPSVWSPRGPLGAGVVSATHPGASAAGPLVGRVTEPRLAPPRRFDLGAALRDPGFAPRDPATLPVPQAILDALRTSDSILLVGHISPDGDCVGSSVAMARALRAMGKSVDVCIDDELSLGLHGLDAHNDVKRARELAGKRWDMALVLDVASPSRIGGANALLANVSRLAIADHHVVMPAPSAAEFALPPGAPFDCWQEEDFPATALLVGALLARLRPELPASTDLRDLYLPAVVGFSTDTSYGRFPGVDEDFYRYYKHMLCISAQAGLADVKATMDIARPAPFERLVAALAGPPEIARAIEVELERRHASSAARAAAAPLIGRLDALGDLTPTEIFGDRRARPALALTTASQAFNELALEVGRFFEPRLGVMDLRECLRSRLVALRQEVPLAMALSEENGTVVVSVHASRGDGARRLAEHLGGGGHDLAAGARVPGSTIAAVRERTVAWLRSEGLIDL